MTVRIPWDHYEVALLFHSYERVAGGADVNSEAARLSETLRSLAIWRGASIDDTYRNVNGMKMQLANVQYLFTDGKKGLSGGSAMIRWMYEIYQSNPAEYQAFLEEAIRLTHSNASIEDAFFAYAKEHTALSPNKLTDCLRRAANYCHLKKPLLGMTDVKDVQSVHQTIASGKLLRFRYGKDAQNIRNVTQLYYNFVKTYAYVSSDAQISPGCIVRAKAVVSRYVKLGEGTIVNLGALIDHHCEIGAFSHIMMDAVIRGNAVIGKQSWVRANEVVEGEPAPI